jgi:hypothetical protein
MSTITVRNLISSWVAWSRQQYAAYFNAAGPLSVEATRLRDAIRKFDSHYHNAVAALITPIAQRAGIADVERALANINSRDSELTTVLPRWLVVGLGNSSAIVLGNARIRQSTTHMFGLYSGNRGIDALPSTRNRYSAPSENAIRTQVETLFRLIAPHSKSRSFDEASTIEQLIELWVASLPDTPEQAHGMSIVRNPRSQADRLGCQSSFAGTLVNTMVPMLPAPPAWAAGGLWVPTGGSLDLREADVCMTIDLTTNPTSGLTSVITWDGYYRSTSDMATLRAATKDEGRDYLNKMFGQMIATFGAAATPAPTPAATATTATATTPVKAARPRAKAAPKKAAKASKKTPAVAAK